ncbi:hypothetical protein ACH4TU_29290 [Streptomyces physcomitrii]
MNREQDAVRSGEEPGIVEERMRCHVHDEGDAQGWHATPQRAARGGS